MGFHCNAPADSALASFPVVVFTVNLFTLPVFGSSHFLSSFS